MIRLTKPNSGFKKEKKMVKKKKKVTKKVKAKSKEAKVFEVALFKKPIVKGKPKVGRPRTYVETKMNKTIRLSQNQVDLIYSNFETLQSFIEYYFSKLEKEVERKQARKLNLID